MAYDSNRPIGDAELEGVVRGEENTLSAKELIQWAEQKTFSAEKYQRGAYNFSTDSATDTNKTETSPPRTATRSTTDTNTTETSSPPTAAHSTFSLSIIKDIRPTSLDLFNPSHSLPANKASTQKSEARSGREDSDSIVDVLGDQSSYTLTPSTSQDSFEVIKDTEHFGSGNDGESDDLSFTNMAMDSYARDDLGSTGNFGELRTQDDNARTVESADNFSRLGRQGFWTKDHLDLEGHSEDKTAFEYSWLPSTESADSSSILKMLDDVQTDQFLTEGETRRDFSFLKQETFDDSADKNWAEIDEALHLLSEIRTGTFTNNNSSTMTNKSGSYHRNSMCNTAENSSAAYEQRSRSDRSQHDLSSQSPFGSQSEESIFSNTHSNGISSLSHQGDHFSDMEHTQLPSVRAVESTEAFHGGHAWSRYDGPPTHMECDSGSLPLDYVGQDLFFRRMASSSWDEDFTADELPAQSEYTEEDLYFQPENAEQKRFFCHPGMSSDTWTEAIVDDEPAGESYAGQELFFRHPGMGSATWEADQSEGGQTDYGAIGGQSPGVRTYCGVRTGEVLQRDGTYLSEDDEYVQRSISPLNMVNHMDLESESATGVNDYSDMGTLESAEQFQGSDRVDLGIDEALQPTFTDTHVSSYTPDSGTHESHQLLGSEVSRNDVEVEQRLPSMESAEQLHRAAFQKHDVRTKRSPSCIDVSGDNAEEPSLKNSVESAEHFHRNQNYGEKDENLARQPSYREMTDCADKTPVEHLQSDDIFNQQYLTKEPSYMEYSSCPNAGSESDQESDNASDGQTDPHHYFTSLPHPDYEGLLEEIDRLSTESAEHLLRDRMYDSGARQPSHDALDALDVNQSPAQNAGFSTMESAEHLLRDRMYDTEAYEPSYDALDAISADHNESEHNRTNTARYDYYDESTLVDFGLSHERPLASPQDFRRDRMFEDTRNANFPDPSKNTADFERDSFESFNQMQLIKEQLEQRQAPPTPDDTFYDKDVKNANVTDLDLENVNVGYRNVEGVTVYDNDLKVNVGVKEVEDVNVEDSEQTEESDANDVSQNESHSESDFDHDSGDYESLTNLKERPMEQTPLLHLQDSHDAFNNADRINQANEREEQWKLLQKNEPKFREGENDSWHENLFSQEGKNKRSSLLLFSPSAEAELYVDPSEVQGDTEEVFDSKNEQRVAESSKGDVNPTYDSNSREESHDTYDSSVEHSLTSAAEDLPDLTSLTFERDCHDCFEKAKMMQCEDAYNFLPSQLPTHFSSWQEDLKEDCLQSSDIMDDVSSDDDVESDSHFDQSERAASPEEFCEMARDASLDEDLRKEGPMSSDGNAESECYYEPVERAEPPEFCDGETPDSVQQSDSLTKSNKTRSQVPNSDDTSSLEISAAEAFSVGQSEVAPDHGDQTQPDIPYDAHKEQSDTESETLSAHSFELREAEQMVPQKNHLLSHQSAAGTLESAEFLQRHKMYNSQAPSLSHADFRTSDSCENPDVGANHVLEEVFSQASQFDDVLQRGDVYSKKDQTPSQTHLDQSELDGNLSGSELVQEEDLHEASKFEAPELFLSTEPAGMTVESAEVLTRHQKNDQTFRQQVEGDSDNFRQTEEGDSDMDRQEIEGNSDIAKQEVLGDSDTLSHQPQAHTLEFSDVLQRDSMYSADSQPEIDENLDHVGMHQTENKQKAKQVEQTNQYFSPLPCRTVESTEVLARDHDYQRSINEGMLSPLLPITTESAEIQPCDEQNSRLTDHDIRQSSATFLINSDQTSEVGGDGTEYQNWLNSQIGTPYIVDDSRLRLSVESAEVLQRTTMYEREEPTRSDWNLADHISPQEMQQSERPTAEPDILNSALNKIFAEQQKEPSHKEPEEPEEPEDPEESRPSRRGSQTESLFLHPVDAQLSLQALVEDFADGSDSSLTSGSRASAQERRQPLKSSGRRSWYKMDDLSENEGKYQEGKQKSTERLQRSDSTASRRVDAAQRESTAGLYSMYNPSQDLEQKQSYTVKPTPEESTSATGTSEFLQVAAMTSQSVESSGFDTHNHTAGDQPTNSAQECGEFLRTEPVKIHADSSEILTVEHPIDHLFHKEEWGYDVNIVAPFRKVLKLYGTICAHLHNYIMNSLKKLENKYFRIIFFNVGVATDGQPSIILITQIYRAMNKQMKTNLKQLLIVHPNLKIKTELKTVGRASLSKDFYNKIVFVKSLQDLSRSQSVQFTDVPKSVRDYDRKKTTKFPQNTCC